MNNIPELKPNEIFIESARVFKNNEYFNISIGKVISKKDQNEMATALKHQLNANKVYLMTSER